MENFNDFYHSTLVPYGKVVYIRDYLYEDNNAILTKKGIRIDNKIYNCYMCNGNVFDITTEELKGC